jgi:two-component system sensor histidine kinase AlgZ
MNNPRSIKQITRIDVLPNFRNLGIMLRILLISNGLALLHAIVLANAWIDVAQQMTQVATLFTPVLFASLLLLWLVQPLLDRLLYWQGVLAVMTLVTSVTLSVYYFGDELYLYGPVVKPGNYFDETRYALLSVMVCGVMLLYFRLRARMLSRALHDARLQVLRARIRPHFLFNTINAVLGIVRTQPKRAETALEDMADLFRMAMSDARDLVPLQREIQLCKQYIALEQLRMGERLDVDWQIRDIPEDALIPPLLLQPLLENAVYHGIEPLPQGGRISIVLHRSGDQLHLKVENPCLARNGRTPRIFQDELDSRENVPEQSALSRADNRQHRNNKMALQNIRERLELLFDAEAHYQTENGEDYYRVEIALPYVKERPPLKEQPA